MSHTIRNLLTVAVMTTVVGATSAAQAAQINSPVLRRQHPGVGFYSSTSTAHQVNAVRQVARPQFTSFLVPQARVSQARVSQARVLSRSTIQPFLNQRVVGPSGILWPQMQQHVQQIVHGTSERST